MAPHRDPRSQSRPSLEVPPRRPVLSPSRNDIGSRYVSQVPVGSTTSRYRYSTSAEEPSYHRFATPRPHASACPTPPAAFARRSICDQSDTLPTVHHSRAKTSPWVTSTQHGVSNGGSSGRRKDRVRKYWLWEVSACIFSFACIAAIVGVLLYEDGKQLDQWKLLVAPNAVVSFLATLAKSSFLLAIEEVLSQLKWLHFHGQPRRLTDLNLFDEASRGPLGSTQLIISQHRKAFLGTLAAVVVMLAILVDPFVQLVFSFPSLPAIQPSVSATFSVSQTYDPAQMIVDAHDKDAGPLALPGDLQAAIARGIYNQIFQPSFNCPLGNCTWSNVVTLSVCTLCMNLSSQTTRGCAVDDTAPSNTCNYTLPDQVNLTATYYLDETGDTEQLTRWNAVSTSKSYLGYGQKIEGEATLCQFDAIQIARPKNFSDPLPAQAWKCNISLCIKTYKTVQSVNGTVILPLPTEQPLYAHDTDEAAFDLNDTLLQLTTQSDNTQDTYPYSINRANYYSLANSLRIMFSSAWSDGGGDETLASWLSEGPDPDPGVGVLSVGPALYNSSDLSTSMAFLANSLTETIRTGVNSTTVSGAAYAQKTFIQVTWAWLALPIVLLLLSCVMLLVVARRAHVLGVPAWKSDQLPVLFCQLHGFPHDDVPLYAGTKDLEGKIRQLRFRLSSDGRIILVKNE